MSSMTAIAGAIIAIFGIILLHELGHFWCAKLFNIKILRFSIGFGPSLLKRTSKAGTEYVLALIPLGGYVKMLGEDRKDRHQILPEELSQSFGAQPVWKRFTVVVAGPFVNFLIALLAFALVFLMGIVHIKPIVGEVAPHSIAAAAGIRLGDEILSIDGMSTHNWQGVMIGLIMHTGEKGSMDVMVRSGDDRKLALKVLNLDDWKIDQHEPDFLNSLGIMPYEPKVIPIISEVLEDSSAKNLLKSGDRVVSINGKKMSDWMGVVQEVRQYPNQTVDFVVLRNQKYLTIPVPISNIPLDKKVGYLGIQADFPPLPETMMKTLHFNLLTAWGPALEQIEVLTKFNFAVMVKMLQGKISLHTLGGPISIFHAAGQASEQGLQVYLGFVAFISLTVGFINLLPIPGLDGGHLLFYVLEVIFRRPVPERYQMVGLSLGMAFLILLMAQATINDLLRLFNF